MNTHLAVPILIKSPFPIKGIEFIESIPNLERLSSTHCKVIREDDGKAYIVDLSTNGTFFENDKLGKGVKKELNSGDKVYLLHHSKVPQDGNLQQNPS